MNIIDLAIDVPSEEASVSYPECIMWPTVSCELVRINWNKP